MSTMTLSQLDAVLATLEAEAAYCKYAVKQIEAMDKDINSVTVKINDQDMNFTEFDAFMSDKNNTVFKI